MIHYLFESGAVTDLSWVRTDGSTPLSLAARSGCAEAVEFLLQKGARDRKLSVGP